MEIKTVNNGYRETIWMHGNKNDKSYFVCQYRDDMHLMPDAPVNSEYVIFCKKYNKVLESTDECNLDCDEYGYCDTCRGFSAVGCQVCEIPRGYDK